MTITLTRAPDTLPETVARCRAEQQLWRERTVRQRLQSVRALRRLLVEECDALCAGVREDLGKAGDEVIGAEILPLADACQFLAREAAALLRPRRISFWSRPWWMWGQRDTVHRRPRGVVGIIGTWNFPLF